jgi:hypothetical protein
MRTESFLKSMGGMFAAPRCDRVIPKLTIQPAVKCGSLSINRGEPPGDEDDAKWQLRFQIQLFFPK